MDKRGIISRIIRRDARKATLGLCTSYSRRVLTVLHLSVCKQDVVIEVMLRCIYNIYVARTKKYVYARFDLLRP